MAINVNGGTLVINQGTRTRIQIVNEGTLIGIMRLVIGYGYKCQWGYTCNSSKYND